MTHLSAVAKEIETRGKWSAKVDVTDFLDHSGQPLPRIEFRILKSREAGEAAIAAHAQASRDSVRRRAERGFDTLIQDPDFLNDIKNVEALWRACRDADDPSLPAFPSPEWMLDNLDTDQIVALIRIYGDCRKTKAGIPRALSRDFLDSVRFVIATSDEIVPESPLANMDRDYLSTFVVAMAKAWHDDRVLLTKETERLEARVKELEAQCTASQ
jgi:hypothetical protein